MLKLKNHLTPALTIVAFVAISTCALAQNEDEPSTTGVVATVNDRPIQQISIDNIARQIATDGQQADTQQILDELINLELLTQAAEELDLDKEPEISATLQLQYTQTMANAYLARKGAQMNFTEEQLREEYETQSENADRAEYRASHILLETAEEAASIVSELADGKPFADAAKQYSIDPSGDNGGDLGWFVGTSMVPEFAEAISEMEVGAISESPVKSEFGYHIINLLDKREAQLPGFDSVKEDLTNLAVRRALAAHVEELKAAATIDTSPE